MRTTWLVTLMLPSLAAAAAGQTSDSATLAFVTRLRPGTTVRLHDRVLGRLEAPLASVSPSTLYLFSGSADTIAVPGSGIDSLWVRGTAAGSTAMAGGLVGGLLGGVAMAILISGECACGDESSCDYLILPGAAAGALLGGVVGALAGSGKSAWHRRRP